MKKRKHRPKSCKRCGAILTVQESRLLKHKVSENVLCGCCEDYLELDNRLKQLEPGQTITHWRKAG